MSVRKTIVRNTAFNTAGRVWEGVCNLILTAYIVPRVGLSGWGLWALIGVFTGYAALLDFGMGSGFAKFIAEHTARKEERAVSAVVNSGLFFYLVLGVVLVGVGWACIEPLIDLMARWHPDRVRLTFDAAFLEDVRFLLRWSLVLFAVSNCVAAITAVQSGLQRMGITNALSFVGSLLKVAATIVFLEAGHGVRGLLYANGLVLAFFGLSGIIVAFVVCPGLRIGPRYVDRHTLGRLFSFGWQTQVSRLSNLVAFQTDKIIVGLAYVGLGPVGLYRIGEEAASKVRQLPALLVSAIIPAASDLEARGDHDTVRRLYLLSSKYVAAAATPLVAFWVGSSGVLIRAWMGPHVDQLEVAVWINRIIALGYLANVLPGAGVSIALGKGRPDVQMKAGILSMVANILLTIVLVFPFGLYGVALGTALSMVLSCAWFIRAMRPVVGVGARELMRAAIVWPIVAALPGLIVCVAGDWFTASLHGRLPNAATALACGGLLAISYLVILRFTPFLEAFDVDFLANTLKLRYVPGFAAWSRRAARRV